MHMGIIASYSILRMLGKASVCETQGVWQTLHGCYLDFEIFKQIRRVKFFFWHTGNAEFCNISRLHGFVK